MRMATRGTSTFIWWMVICVLLLTTTTVAQRCTKRCPKNTRPVCGSDGKTYKNQCKLENRQCSSRSLVRVSVGECPPAGCKRQCGNTYEPVCGSDGVTYNNLCHLDNSACDNPLVSMRSNGICQKEVIIVDFQTDISASAVTTGPSDVTLVVALSSAAGSQSLSGRGLWKLGIYASHYEEGCRWNDPNCPKVNHIPQILSEEQASTSLVGGQPLIIPNIQTRFDVSIIGCDDLPYICVEIGKGDNPIPDYRLTMDFYETALNCWRLDCYPQEVPDPVAPTPACRYECPETGNVVCGTDGETYSTECSLDNERRCGEDPNSYLLARKHYGHCRAGVIIDSVFWTAQAKEATGTSGDTLVAVEALIVSNATGESIAGRNLWRMGLFGSQFADGSGPRLGYVKQLLDNAQASTSLAAGKAIMMMAETDFDVAAVGCSQYKFICLEFTNGDSPQPPFPFHGNSGPEEGSAFMDCQRVPCTREPEPEVPDDGRPRVVLGQVGWGLRAGGLRDDGLYDVTVNLNAQILPESDYVAGSNLLRVGLFGSQNQDGSGPRFGLQRQILTSRDTSRTMAPRSSLTIDDIQTKFLVTGLGCSEYIYLCLELAKGDSANPDFVFVSENTDTSSTPDGVILCKQIPCRNPTGESTNEPTRKKKTGLLKSFGWGITVDSFNSPEPSDLQLGIEATQNPETDLIGGTGLWRVGLYASDDSDPMGPKYRYQNQILSDEQQTTVLRPNAKFEIQDIRTRFNVDGLGCGQLTHICIEFTRGDSPDPDFLLPLPHTDDDGVTKRIARCKAWPCRESGGSTGGHSGSTGGHGGSTGGQGGSTGGHGGSTGGQGGSTGGQGGSTGGQGGSTGGHGGNTGGHGGSTGGHGGNTEQGGGMEGPPKPLVAFSRLHWSRHLTSVNPNGPTTVKLEVTLTPDAISHAIEGYNLWEVRLFGSDTQDGTGLRFDERSDVLSHTDRSKPVIPGENLVFNITTLFEMRGVGCGEYPYICIQFGKDMHSWPSFRLALGRSDTIVSCRQVVCDPNAGHDGSNPGGHGSGGMLDPSLPTASLHNISWNIAAGESRPGSPTDVTVHVIMYPKSYTDTIRGQRLWRLGLFGNTRRDGSGQDRLNYISQILSPEQAKQIMEPNSPLEFEVDTRFLLHGLGCDLHRYLCVEFAKHDHPKPQFNFPVEDGAIVSCRAFLCRDLPQPEPGPSGRVARIQDFSWRLQQTEVNPEGPTDLRLFVDVLPDANTDVINGRHLWKVGIYGSKYREGREPYEERLSYDPQLLQVPDARRTLAPGRPLNFDLNFKFDMWKLGCGAYKYFCVEFTKDHLAEPAFDMPFSSGDVTVHCERVPCQTAGGTTGTSGPGGQPNPNPKRKIVGFTGVSWQVTPPEIYSDGQSDLRILADLTPHPDSDSITGQEGSGLWRIGIYANRHEDGTHRQKLNYDRQILSHEDRDQSLNSPDPLHFDISVPFNLRRAHCDSDFPFLCLEIGKGDSAHPDYSLPLPNEATSFVTCQKSPCLPDRIIPRPSTASDHLPIATVSSINIASISLEPNAMNRMQLQAVVYFAPGGPTIRGTNLWQLGMWGSTMSDGSGLRTGEVTQVLSQENVDRNLVPPEPLFFSGIRYDVDMQGRECGLITHVCAAFTKLEASDPQFHLVSPENTNMATVCRAVECQEPLDPQIAVTGLALFNNIQSTIFAGRPNRMSLGVFVRYDEPDTVGFEGTNLWGLKVWLSAKSNGKGRKLAPENQALTAEHVSQPLVVGTDLQFERISFSANLLGNKCKQARYVCASLYKDPKSSVAYTLVAKPNLKALTKCLPINCA